MKRLIRESQIETKIKALIDLYNKLSDKKTAEVGSEHKIDTYRYVIAFLIKAEMDWYYNTDEDFEEMANRIENYQEQGGSRKVDNWTFVFDEGDFDMNAVQKDLPDAIQTETAYRTILLDKDKIDEENIEDSIRNMIHKNPIESWTTEKKYADNLENTLLQGSYDPNTQVPVRMKGTMTGIDLPEFWKEVLEKKFDNNRKLFDENFKNIDNAHKHEKEILGPPPSTYEIYNLNEIEQALA